jgi:hypothetical protein
VASFSVENAEKVHERGEIPSGTTHAMTSFERGPNPKEAVMRKILLVTFVLAMLPACSRASTSTPVKAPTPAAATQKAQAKPADKVAVLEAKNMKRKTELIGFLDVAGDKGHKDAALDALRAKAAAMGADAIVGVEFHEGNGEPGHYSGVAVRYKRTHRRGSGAAAKTLDASQPRTQSLPAPQQPAPKK